MMYVCLSWGAMSKAFWKSKQTMFTTFPMSTGLQKVSGGDLLCRSCVDPVAVLVCCSEKHDCPIFEFSIYHLHLAFLPLLPSSSGQKEEQWTRGVCVCFTFIIYDFWELCQITPAVDQTQRFQKALSCILVFVLVCYWMENMLQVTPHINIFNLHEMRFHTECWPTPVPVACASNRISLSCGCFGISSLQKEGNSFWIKLLFLSISLVGKLNLFSNAITNKSLCKGIIRAPVSPFKLD